MKYILINKKKDARMIEHLLKNTCVICFRLLNDRYDTMVL